MVDGKIHYFDCAMASIANCNKLPEGISINIPVLSHHYPIIILIRPY